MVGCGSDPGADPEIGHSLGSTSLCYRCLWAERSNREGNEPADLTFRDYFSWVNITEFMASTWLGMGGSIYIGVGLWAAAHPAWVLDPALLRSDLCRSAPIDPFVTFSMLCGWLILKLVVCSAKIMERVKSHRSHGFMGLVAMVSWLLKIIISHRCVTSVATCYICYEWFAPALYLASHI